MDKSKKYIVLWNEEEEKWEAFSEDLQESSFCRIPTDDGAILALASLTNSEVRVEY